MAKFILSNLDEVLREVSNGNLKPDDVFVLDPDSAMKSSYSPGYFVSGNSLSGINVGELFSEKNTNFMYLIRKEEDSEGSSSDK